MLIVDDNDTNRRILRAQVEAWGMEADETASPLAALELIRTDGSSYDLVLLDYQMPEMDGLELVREIGQLGLERPIPMVMLTSVGLMSRELTSLAGSLTKPAKPSALHDVIVSIFAGRPAVVRSKATRTAMDGEMAVRTPLKILVAEDNAVNQKLVLRLLERLGYSADLVENGLEAVAAVDGREYDLVLMDLQMPELDGLEATRRILERHPDGAAPRIAALTANAMAEDRAMCIAAGMHDYLSKPIRPPKLEAAWNGGLRDHRPRRAAGTGGRCLRSASLSSRWSSGLARLMATFLGEAGPGADRAVPRPRPPGSFPMQSTRRSTAGGAPARCSGPTHTLKSNEPSVRRRGDSPDYSRAASRAAGAPEPSSGRSRKGRSGSVPGPSSTGPAAALRDGLRALETA